MLSLPPAFASPVAASSTPMATSRSHARVVLVASSDSSLRERLRQSLSGLRWQVLEAPGGAEAWEASRGVSQLEALLIDPWLPDLDVQEFLQDFHHAHPQVDLMMTDGASVGQNTRSPYRQELLYALRRSQDGDTAAWLAAPALEQSADRSQAPQLRPLAGRTLPAALPLTGYELDKHSLHAPVGPVAPGGVDHEAVAAISSPSRVAEPERVGAGKPVETPDVLALAATALRSPAISRRETTTVERIPELIGNSPIMLEVSRRIRLVAARTTPVLIEGPTGTGKELVAEALHRLSNRSRRPFVAINCAAIPEALLEAELFGHTRGAFTGAVHGRTGRIESADGGTLFLDEIGEMPLALQSKLLRFFESGELQRIGDNETVKVDVRLVAATHQPLAEDAQKGLFRADLYYRLAVFLIHTPALLEHMEDLPQLVGHFLEQLGRRSPVKRIELAAVVKLSAHSWPGNVRELEHVLERAAILAGDEPLISANEIDFGFSPVN